MGLSMIWVGIDPGLSGAVAFIDEAGQLETVDAPAVEARKGRDYLVAEMASIIATRIGADTRAALEQGIAMPRQSSSTTAKQFKGIGLWEGILAAYAVPYELVTPSAWKKSIGLPAGASKGESRMLACRLFPSASGQFARVKDEGRAEAALIAEWLRRRG